MKALAEIRKQREQSYKEVERVRQRIETMYHEIDQLKEWIDKELHKVNEYDIILEHCETLKEVTS